MFRIQYAIGTLALAAAFLVTAPGAKADQSYRGTFHLPFQTYWGGSVLAPGDYTISMGDASERAPVLRIQGAEGTANILAGPAELHEGRGPGRLVLANVNGIYAIREFDAGAAGKSFSFPLPKAISGLAVKTSVVTAH